MTYNCKNIKTSGGSINELCKLSDILLLQETWLFQCEISLLSEVQGGLLGIGKCIDSDNPIPPSKFPRGHGAIMWKKELDAFIKMKPDGNNNVLN